jgi:hypothetical protein
VGERHGIRQIEGKGFKVVGICQLTELATVSSDESRTMTSAQCLVQD